MAGRLASAGAALTTNGIEAIGGGNDEPSLLCGGWPSIAIWRNPPPFRPVNGAQPLTASSVPGTKALTATTVPGGPDGGVRVIQLPGGLMVPTIAVLENERAVIW